MILLIEREIRSEQKVADGVFVEHTVDEDAVGMALKIDPVVARPVAVQGTPIARDAAELFPVERIEVAGQKMELGQQVELQILR